MQKKVRIRVTQKDIDKNGRGSCTRCAVASACQRKFGYKFKYASYDGITLIYRHLSISNKVTTWMRKFDIGYNVKPFSFVVTCDEEDLK